jgi:hypothetical protein
LRVSFEASAKHQIEKAKKEITRSASVETKKLNNALASAKKQMSTVVSTNQKQQQKIENLERQLASKTTPQHEGLADEKILMAALKKEYPKDNFLNTGKGGDIVHEVNEGQKTIGVIVYECKRVSHWSNGHVEQTAQARLQRQADYGVLVTNAMKKGTSGMFVQKGIVVIHTGGVLALVAILRENLVTVARLRLSKIEREEAVKLTMGYIQGSEFKNSMEVVVRKAVEMAEDLKKEQQDHMKTWLKRYEGLKAVYVNAAGVRSKTQVLLTGKTAKQLETEDVRAFPSLEGNPPKLLSKD